MLKSSLFDYINGYVLAKDAISIALEPQAKPNNNVKEILFKSSALFTNCISEINNAQLDNAKNINVAIPMYNLTEYSNNYSKTSESLWKYYRGEPFLDPNDTITDFSTANNNNALFNLNKK